MITPKNSWGQIFVLGYRGLYPPDEFIHLIKQYKIGGVILFSENIDDLKQLRQTILNLQSLSPISLFVMVDQEGGKSNRITKDFPTFPGNSYFGQKKDEQGTKGAYYKTAKGLRNLGINVNLAPVVDVLTNPKNKLLRERSFGNDPQVVAELARVAIQSTKSEGIFSCAKHFPGLGNVNVDPHRELPVDKNDLKKFEQINFIPFVSAIKAQVEMIMTTHILCEKLDSSFPATLSETICQEILRQKLNFDGLVITDDMGMGGITKNWEIDFACQKAFMAGHDLILLAKDWEKQKGILENFEKAVRDKGIREERIKSSINKILKFKRRLKYE